MAKSRATSSYHRLEAWPRVTVAQRRQRAAQLNAILGRLIDEQIDALSNNFNRSSRIILGLPEDDAAIEVQLVTSEMAEACASFLEALASQPTASALALSTEMYCLAYISIAKQGNITDNKLTAICNAILVVQ